MKYSYFVASLFFLTVWLLVFWRVKPLRRHMLILSLITAAFGPVSEIWYFADYWKPEIAFPLPIGGVEDLIFGFAIGGIGAFAYESLSPCSLTAFVYVSQGRGENGSFWFL